MWLRVVTVSLLSCGLLLAAFAGGYWLGWAARTEPETEEMVAIVRGVGLKGLEEVDKRLAEGWHVKAGYKMTDRFGSSSISSMPPYDVLILHLERLKR